MSYLISPQNGKQIKYIIHASDIHIRTGDLERSTLSNLDETIIILTGDIFHNKGKIEPAGICLAHYLLENLLKFCDVFFICGNHDYRQDDPNIPDMIDSIYSNYFKSEIEKSIFFLFKTS